MVTEFSAFESEMQKKRMNGAKGMSDMEGKVTRVGASERGQRTSFDGAESG